MQHTRNLAANHVGAFAALVIDTLGDHGLWSTTTAMLLWLRTRPAATIGDLADGCGLAHSSAVRAIDRLVATGLVERASSSTDRRRRHVTLTPAGRRRADELQRQRLEALTALLTSMDDEQVRQLDSDLSHLLTNATRDRSHAQRTCRLCDHAICTGAACPIGRAADAIDNTPDKESPSQ